ncbi:LysR family transcriptional regulator [Brevibacterium sp. CFH 10365]|uniref:LysR family transcriptional regulator n=1 Tax=Brevibacterium sp. CFH 10365 TaxID=2585207 RepID=UPI00126652B5|nr:LysR family transcriptional regulator [Brevibacterium sp. CFH 10365]
MISADDLQVFLEVSRRGRLTEAAKILHVNHTTVSRHISRLEKATDRRLFDRRYDGWTLTEAGLRLLVHAETVEAALLQAEDECASRDSSLSGQVRVIVPDGLGSYVVIPQLGQLRRRHPQLCIEIITANRHNSLAPREFDLAVTIERPHERAVVVRKLVDYSLRFYASRDYLAEHRPISEVTDLYDHQLIWYLEDALDDATYSQLFRIAPEARPHIQTNSITGQILAACRGAGLCLIPSYIGDETTDLQRIDVAGAAVHKSYWVSAPKDLVKMSRVRTMLDYLLAVASDL